MSREFFPFTYLSVHYQDFGTPPRFSYGNKHQRSFKTYPLKTETQLLAPAGLAGSSDFSPSLFPSEERSEGWQRAGTARAPPPLPAGRAAGRGLHNPGEGAAVRAEGRGEGAERPRQTSERDRRCRRQRWERFAPPHAQTPRGFRPSRSADSDEQREADRGRQESPGPVPSPAPPPLTRSPPPPPPTPPAPHLSNAPAHWATPPQEAAH